MEELKVKKVIISKQAENSENFQKLQKIANKNNVEVIVINKGDKIKIENDIYIDILWPNDKKMIRKNVLNNNSIVCKLYYKDFSMLFTGDIEETAEKQILEEYKNNLKVLESTVLKVAHHGSNSSSTNEFIKEIKPKLSLIGVGEKNKFGHPDQKVIERLKNANTKIYRTDEMGEIEIWVNHLGKYKIRKMIQNNKNVI